MRELTGFALVASMDIAKSEQLAVLPWCGKTEIGDPASALSQTCEIAAAAGGQN